MKAAVPPPLNSVKRGPGRTISPMLLSAVVYPGAGQLMQRRWVAGVCMAAVFSVFFGWMVVEVYAVLKAYYAFMTDFKGATGEAPGAASIILPFILSTAVYVAGLVDTSIAEYRIGTRARRIIS